MDDRNSGSNSQIIRGFLSLQFIKAKGNAVFIVLRNAIIASFVDFSPQISGNSHVRVFEYVCQLSVDLQVRGFRM